MSARINICQEQIAAFCQRNQIRRLALFGSVLRDDFTPQSDVDVLVEFMPQARVGYIRLAGMERELSSLVGGHKVDMCTAACLSKYFRDEVLREAEEQYVQA